MNKQEFLKNLPVEIRESLAASAEWRLISLLLERPREGWYPMVQSLAMEVEDPSLLAAADSARCATEEVYLMILGPGAQVSPREVAYAGFEDPGSMFADIQSFYTAFSYSPAAEDPSDHISVEAGFAGFLSLKDVYARLSDSDDAIDVTQAALQHFLEEHLARLARGMARKLTGPGPAYLNKTLEAVLKRLAHIPETTASQRGEGLDEPLECGLKCEPY